MKQQLGRELEKNPEVYGPMLETLIAKHKPKPPPVGGSSATDLDALNQAIWGD